MRDIDFLQMDLEGLEDRARLVGIELKVPLKYAEGEGLRLMKNLWRWGLQLTPNNVRPTGNCHEAHAADLMASECGARCKPARLVEVFTKHELIEPLNPGLRVSGIEKRYGPLWDGRKKWREKKGKQRKSPKGLDSSENVPGDIPGEVAGEVSADDPQRVKGKGVKVKDPVVVVEERLALRLVKGADLNETLARVRHTMTAMRSEVREGPALAWTARTQGQLAWHVSNRDQWAILFAWNRYLGQEHWGHPYRGEPRHWELHYFFGGTFLEDNTPLPSDLAEFTCGEKYEWVRAFYNSPAALEAHAPEAEEAQA